MPSASDPRITVRLTPELHDALVLLARIREVKPPALVREAIERLVEGGTDGDD